MRLQGLCAQCLSYVPVAAVLFSILNGLSAVIAIMIPIPINLLLEPFCELIRAKPDSSVRHTYYARDLPTGGKFVNFRGRYPEHLCNLICFDWAFLFL